MNSNHLSLKTLYNAFLEMEETFDLFSKEINGVLFWERIRFNIFQIIAKAVLYKTIPERDSLSSKVKNYLLKVKNYLVTLVRIDRNPFFVKQKDIIFFTNSRRKLGDNNKWWDLYTDYFVDLLPYSSFNLEKDFEFRYYAPTQTKNVRYFTFIEMIARFQKALKIKRVTFTEDEKEFLEVLSREIFNKFKVKIDLVEYVYGVLLKRELYLPLFKRLLRKIKPKLAIVVCSYGKETFIEACRNLNIIVVELQHGVITKYHVGYSFERPNARKTLFPDYFLSFGQYWKESINYPIPKNKIINVGFPALEKLKMQYKNTVKRKQIVFVSQLTIGKQLSKFAVELHKTPNFPYHIVYKLHPTETSTWKQKYPELLESGIEVIDHTGKDLYQLFAESEIQIGVYSTAIFEGLCFNLKTFLLDIPGIEYMEDLLKWQFAHKISSVKELIKHIEAPQTKSLDTEVFFKSNAVTNIIKTIEQLIQQ
ncbi:MAG: hypothetical protein ACTSUF_07960 [Candidatus Heimdallarchaeaceae archaeon]